MNFSYIVSSIFQTIQYHMADWSKSFTFINYFFFRLNRIRFWTYYKCVIKKCCINAIFENNKFSYVTVEARYRRSNFDELIDKKIKEIFKNIRKHLFKSRMAIYQEARFKIKWPAFMAYYRNNNKREFNCSNRISLLLLLSF